MDAQELTSGDECPLPLNCVNTQVSLMQCDERPLALVCVNGQDSLMLGDERLLALEGAAASPPWDAGDEVYHNERHETSPEQHGFLGPLLGSDLSLLEAPDTARLPRVSRCGGLLRPAE